MWRSDTTTENITEAVEAARQADVVVAVVGGSSARDFKTSYKSTGAAETDSKAVSDMDCGEGFDRATLEPLGLQLRLLRELKQTGKPLVVVYVEGRPLLKEWAADNADALPNMPWEERPAGSHAPMWRYSQNPIIPRDLLPTSNRIFNSAVVPFKDGFAGVFRCDDTNRRMVLHVGFSKDGIHWNINEEPLRFHHGVLHSCNGYVYSFGSALLDLDEPWKPIYRSGPYLISPQKLYELTGDVPNVCFPCAELHDPETGRVAVAGQRRRTTEGLIGRLDVIVAQPFEPGVGDDGYRQVALHGPRLAAEKLPLRHPAPLLLHGDH